MKRNYRFKIIIATVLIFMLTSCGEDYLYLENMNAVTTGLFMKMHNMNYSFLQQMIPGSVHSIMTCLKEFTGAIFCCRILKIYPWIKIQKTFTMDSCIF